MAVKGDTHRSHGGPSRMVPARRLRVTGRDDRQVSASHASQPFSPQAVGRCWTPRNGKRGRRLKSLPTGGHAEQAYKHRARDAGETADLRFITTRQASVPRGAEARGSNMTPAFRAPSFFGASRNKQGTTGDPAPKTSSRGSAALAADVRRHHGASGASGRAVSDALRQAEGDMRPAHVI